MTQTTERNASVEPSFEEPVTALTLNCPDVHNAIDPDMAKAMRADLAPEYLL